jgi:hypothetical protein
MDSQKLKYDGLHSDDRSDSRSSTEVESLMGEEKQWHDVELNGSIRRTKRNKLVTALKSSRWIIDTSLLLIILALLARDQLRKPTVLQDPNIWQFGQDFTGVGPKCGKETPHVWREPKANSYQSRPKSPRSFETSRMRRITLRNSSATRFSANGTR